MIHKKSTEEELAYQGTLHYLYNNLAAYQQQGNKAIKKMGLEKITKLCKALGHPEKKFKSIHIAGTNGKGSTSHALAAVLQSAGYKTGLYTSPHIKDFRERIQINGKLITKGEVIAFVQKHKNLFENTQASFFEMSVALVFYFFAKQQVDIAVIEVGLGGRLDATNVILPEVALITNISLDHTSILGGTLSAIAYEKAGVVKLQIPLIVGEYDAATAEVFQQVAKAKKAKLVY
ncbi:MAG: Mur ligase family protein, partial [Bacteroidota bacterium]